MWVATMGVDVRERPQMEIGAKRTVILCEIGLKNREVGERKIGSYRGTSDLLRSVSPDFNFS